MQKTTMTGRITAIEPTGTWNNGQRTFNKYRVSFANGDSLGFLAVGEFKNSIGESISYEKNESNQTGKVIRENFQQGGAPSQSTTSKKEDTQTYIIRQSMIKAAVDFHALNAHSIPSENDVINTARNFVTYINNG
jgi:hypothetical protein